MALLKSLESNNLILEREPRRHLKADLSIAKEYLHRMKLMVALYGLWNFSECNIASLLINRVETGPQPPEVENISGEKHPCSTSLTLCSYFLFFKASLSL